MGGAVVSWQYLTAGDELRHVISMTTCATRVSRRNQLGGGFLRLGRRQFSGIVRGDFPRATMSPTNEEPPRFATTAAIHIFVFVTPPRSRLAQLERQ